MILGRSSDEADSRVQIPIESREPRCIEIPDGARSAQLRFDLDPAQSAKLLAAAAR